MASPKINHLSFNHDYTCFSAALDSGVFISQIDPFLTFEPIDSDSHRGVQVVALLFRCSHLCLVGGGPNPIAPPRQVMIWNNFQSRFVGQISSRSEVKNVKFRRDNIVVVGLQKINVYKFPELRLLNQIETDLNPNGLCEISYAQSPMVLVCPGLRKGEIRVKNFGSRKGKFIVAHDSIIACMAMTPDGKLLATASTRGTLIRVFNTLDGSLLQEVRRGSEKAEIYSLAFSSNARWLAVSSDKGTVHVFGLKVDLGSLAASKNDRSQLASSPNHANGFGISSLLKGVLPKYFSSEWSVAQFRLPEGRKHIVGFGHQNNTIVIISMDGSFYRCKFDPVAGGEMTQLEHINFLNPGETFT